MRCQDRLVQVGAAMYEVQSLCGPPDQVTQRVETRSVPRAIQVPCRRGVCTAWVNDTIEEPVEDWVYDLGRQRFVRYLTFKNGRLVRVREGGYGTKDVGAGVTNDGSE